MRFANLGAALLISAVVIFMVWLVGRAVGFHVSLVGSLGLTLLLTLVVNLVLGAFSSRRRASRYPG